MRLAIPLSTAAAVSLIVSLSIVCDERAEARGPRTKTVKTFEEKFADCKANSMGWTIMVRNGLNEARNPLADNVSSTNWEKFCTCLVPKSDAIDASRPPGHVGDDVLTRLRDEYSAAILDCAKVSIAPAQAASKAVIAPPAQGGLRPDNDARFRESINFCKSSPSGFLMNLEIHLKVQKSPRAEKVRTIDSGKYCECYVRSYRARLGDDAAHRKLTAWKPPENGQEIMRLAKVSDAVYDECAAEQIPFQQSPPAVPVEVGSSVGYEKVIRATLISGKGIAGIEVNQPVSGLIQVIGPTNFISKYANVDEYRYGPGMVEFVVRVMPSGPNGKIKQITLDNRFLGQTDRGVRIGDSYAQVKAKNGNAPILYEDGKSFLLYKDGTLFGFSGGLNRIAVTTPEGNGLMKLYGDKPGK